MPQASAARKRLVEIVKERSFSTGTETRLVSGRTTSFYFGIMQQAHHVYCSTSSNGWARASQLCEGADLFRVAETRRVACSGGLPHVKEQLDFVNESEESLTRKTLP